jgi:fructuronate reductase
VRLSAAALDKLPTEVSRFNYARNEQAVGIVHLGLGAFHRAHQAVYTDQAMSAGDRDWAICGVSLRSSAVRDQLIPQDSLFSVTQRESDHSTTSVVGSVQAAMVGSERPDAVIAAIAAPSTRMITLTVTEKGHCGAVVGGLNTESSELAYDREALGQPRTIYGFLAAGLAARRAAGLPGLTIVSCDNLSENGQRLASYLSEFLDDSDGSLRAWFEAECACPSTMVDRIVPATTQAQIDELEKRTGMRDEGAVMTERFSQWVIEDRFAGPRPRWEAGGAQFVSAVRPYEEAKLRVLNAAHSALAYIGLQHGHAFVHEAISDAKILELVTRLMLQEAAPTLPETPGLDLNAYAARLINRFNNSALAHRLEQIAMDGSQKIPQRWFPTLRANQAQGKQCRAILEALVAWIKHLRGSPFSVVDPMAATLAELWRTAGPSQIAAALFGPGGLFNAGWTATEADLEFIRSRIGHSD